MPRPIVRRMMLLLAPKMLIARMNSTITHKTVNFVNIQTGKKHRDAMLRGI
jgi:hypothetical protein